MTSGAHLRMNPLMVTTDVEEFEGLLEDAEASGDPVVQREFLEQAVALYRGEFLPGFYEEWVLAERLRLADLFENALGQLTDSCAEQGLFPRGLSYARRLVALNPWLEDRHCRVIEVCLQSGNLAAAQRQDREMRAMLAELGEEPTSRALELSEKMRGPVGIREEAHAEAPIASAPSPDRRRSKLPVRLTRFFGRTEELGHALRWLEESPGALITLTGAGGCGKTRLSVEIGHAVDALGWSVWFIPLADVGSPERIYDAILTGLKIGASQDPIRDLREFFGQVEKPMLILDNFEHLMDDGALFVRRLLAEIPELSCLVSSRQRLSLEGERELPVSPLSAPGEAEITPEQAARFPCVQLYVDRCQTLRPDFQITERNAKAIVNLCERLEGIPLAIEIASSLSQTLSPSQIVDQLDQRLELLTSPRRDIIDRHKTLRNAVAYSYDLLSPLQQRFFASLSVFRGGWTIRSASEVCFLPLDSEHSDCFSLLLQLRERSLVETYETASGEMRFRMLETFRDFGRDCLKKGERDEVLSRYDAYFLAMAEDAYASLRTDREPASLDGLSADYDNLMDVFERAWERRDVEFGIRLAVGFGQIWRSRGAVVRERAIIEHLVSQPEAGLFAPELLMKGLNLLSHASFLLCDWSTSLAAEQRTLDLALATSNHEYAAMSCGGIANVYLASGRVEEAKEMLLRAVEYARLSGVDDRISVLLGNLGVASWREGDLAQAERHFRESLALAEKLDQRAQANHHKLNIARVLLDQGRYGEAFEEMSGCVERSAKLHRALDGAMSLILLAKYYRLTGEPGRASALIQQALERVLGLMNEAFETFAAVELGQQLAGRGLFRDATLVLSSLGKDKLSAIDAKDVENSLVQCKAGLPEADFDRCWAKGVTSTLNEVLRGQLHLEEIAV